VVGPHRRQTLIRVGLGVVLVAVLVWALPERRPDDSGGHHAAPPPAGLDRFERAGVTEFTEGQTGPGFRLSLMDGRVASLDDWRDKLVVLNFWATWCQPCTVEMPALEELWRRYRDRGLVVVGISVDRGAPRGVLEPYLRNLGLTFPILLDPELATASAWRVTALPATFIVRPGGEVAGIAVGAREWNSPEMTALLESLLPRHGHAAR
jgi:peroxiredoxin